MDYARVASYGMNPGAGADELVRKAREGLVPIFERQRGFVSYDVVVSGNRIVSFSRWQSRGLRRPCHSSRGAPAGELRAWRGQLGVGLPMMSCVNRPGDSS
jgi:hypothetical protein